MQFQPGPVPRPDGDLLYGVAQIAEFLGLEIGQARHQCQTGRLPTFKLGIAVCSRRTTLQWWLDQQMPARSSGPTTT